MLQTADCQGGDKRNLVKHNLCYICLACETPVEDFALVCHECKAHDCIVPLDDEDDEPQKRRRARNAIRISTSMPPRITTGSAGLDSVLGGGLVRPSSILMHGPKGVGKTTLLLSILDYIGSMLKKPVLYGSAEMPAEMIKQVCERLQLKQHYLYITDSNNAEDMHDDIAELEPVVVVWDSIQRFRVANEIGIVPLREVVTGAIQSGWRTKAATFLVSHETKSEDYRGESSIGHDVDVILSLKKIDQTTIGIDCTEKNRFGPTPASAAEKLFFLDKKV